MQNNFLWEILVPFNDNDGKKVPNGATQEVGLVRSLDCWRPVHLQDGQGQWLADDVTYFDRVIPVRIMCTEKQIETIMHYSLTFYNQKAVFCYLVSENVKVLHAK